MNSVHSLTSSHSISNRMLHIRIDTTRDNPFFAYLETISDELLIASEKSDTNQHCHVLCETSQSPNSLRMQLRRQGFIGNKSYSISSVRKSIIEIGAYLVKDTDVVRNSYDPYLTQLFYDYDASVKESLKMKTKKNILNEIIKTIDPNDLVPPIVVSKPKADRIQDAILKYYKENDLLVRKFQLKAYYDTILVRYETSNPQMIRDYIFS